MLNDEELRDARLGQTSGGFVLSTRDDNYKVMLSMLQQACHSLDILSHNLDGPLYDTHEFSMALRNLATSNKHSRIRLLVHDSNYLGHHGHRFIELARRLTSSIEIREPAENYDSLLHNYSIFDKHGVIFRSTSERFEAKADFNDPLMARELGQEFEKIWQHAVPSNELRRLHI